MDELEHHAAEHGLGERAALARVHFLRRQEFDAAVKSAGGAKSSAASGGSSASTTQRWDFAKADTNHDGSLSRQEFDAMTKGASAPRANSKSKY